ncbi:SPOR domain-containing protein [Mesorhizobium sp. 1B3]|uniref:SPOR domain-containing protein n=1 Tax=Mesorhizobium sp. 1B3 TaxID=3243599 RepID=UPI003D973FDD
MADSNQLKRVDPVDLGDEDPFAELTRIMGFDPRVPVHPASERQAVPVVAMPAVAAPEPDLDPSSDDLSIDLEKELLGDLALEEASAPDVVAERAAVLPSPIEDGEVDPNLDVAVAADLYDEFAPETVRESFDREPLLSDVDFDAAFERELAFGEDGSHSAVPIERDAELSSLSVEDAALLAVLDPASAFDEPAQQVAPQAGPANSYSGEDLDQTFDLAMAEVDMDFGMDTETSGHRLDNVEHDPDAHQAPVFEAQSDEPAPYQEGSIDFDDFDEASLDEAPVMEEVASEAAYVEPEGSGEFEPQNQAHVDQQASGHDEWQAAEYSEPQPAEYAEWQAEDVAPQGAEPELGAEMAEPAAAMAAEAEPEELSLEDELNALLGNTVPRAKLTGGYDAPPLSAALGEGAASAGGHGEYRSDFANWGSPAASAALTGEASVEAETYRQDDAEYISDDYAGPSYQVAEIEHAQQWSDGSSYAGAEQSTTVELEFDDAFDAAFENSLHAEEAEVNAGQYVGLQSSGSEHFAANRSETVSAYTGADQAHVWHATASAASDEDVPDIETIDVPESAIAVTDDLDIPEVAYEEDVRPAPVFDEFESEFAAVFAEPQQPEATAAHPEDDRDPHAAETQPVEGVAYDYGAGVAAAAVGAGAAYQATTRTHAHRDFDPAQGFNADELPGSRKPVGRDADPFDAVDYNDPDEETTLPPYVETRRAPQRRGLMIAAIVGGVAVLGGVGAFALSFGDGTDVPAIVKADDSPIKVRPENPGGTTVPNQDSKVYQTVAGAGTAAAPAQQKLISSAEEPVDMTAKAPEPEVIPSGVNDGEALDDGDDQIAAITKAEDRIEPSSAADQAGTDNTEVAAVTPRRVRTMVVRPDGTLVPREDPAPVAVPEPRAAAEAMMESQPADASAEPKVAAASPAATSALKPANVPVSATSGTPASVPVAPSRPADQPVNVVGEVKPDQVASISTGAPAAGGWSMQIASQPSEEAAKSSFQDLARRYAGVLGGREATIVKAEIAGKGTYWRVRVPAGSRNDAISLCESYKAAGGNCFVSK